MAKSIKLISIAVETADYEIFIKKIEADKTTVSRKVREWITQYIKENQPDPAA